MKGEIKADHIPLNKYQFIVAGLPPLTFTSVAGIEEALNVITLPDRTVASGGRTDPVEFTVGLPMHHALERAAMELWFQEGQDPVSPTYKKPATMIHISLTGNQVATYSFPDLFVSKRAHPDAELDNDGDMAELTYTMNASDVIAL